MPQATLRVLFGPGRKVVADEWHVAIKDGAQFVQVLIDDVPITVRRDGESFGTHRGGSMVPLRIGQVLEVYCSTVYPGKGRVQVVPMTHNSGRQVRVRPDNRYVLV